MLLTNIPLGGDVSAKTLHLEKDRYGGSGWLGWNPIDVMWPNLLGCFSLPIRTWPQWRCGSHPKGFLMPSKQAWQMDMQEFGGHRDPAIDGVLVGD